MMKRLDSNLLKAEEARIKADADRAKLMTQVSNLHAEVITNGDQLTNIEETLERVADRSIVYAEDDTKNQTFVLIRLPNHDVWDMYAICRQNATVSAAIRRIITANLDSFVILKIEHQPNPKNLLTRIKKQLGHMVEYRINFMRFREGYNMADFIEGVREVHGERFDVEN